MEKKLPHILVLGATGFVGRAIFSYLYSSFPTFGTSQTTKEKDMFLFHEKTAADDFVKIQRKIKNISLVINCIGKYKNASKEDLIRINALLPHQLEYMSKLHKFHLIHISTDAVFGALQGNVTESTTPFPNTLYGMSKLLGEPNSSSAITIRTSFIGLDKISKKGIIETVLREKDLVGYVNHLWSGCTTLQFSQLCASLANESTFHALRKISPVFHFAPLPRKTKYEIMKEILKSQNMKKEIRKVKKEKITRILETNYSNELQLSSYDPTYQKALQSLFSDCKEYMLVG